MTGATATTSDVRATFNIPSLDGLRAIAVLIVFIGHGQIAPSWFPGHVGVTIFFFLSGYLITTLMRREHDRTGDISLSRFYLRRTLRIVPPAYLAILLSIALGASGILAASTSGWGVLSELLNYTNYYLVFADRDGLPPESSMLWSLSVEEHYYLLFPLVVLFLLRRRLSYQRIGWLLLIGAGMVLVWRLYLGLTGASFDRLYVSSDTRMDSLLYGSALALLLNPMFGKDQVRPIRLRPYIHAIAAVAALVFLLSALVPSIAFRLGVADVIQCICLIPIFWSIIALPESFIGRLLNHRWVVTIGVWSFSIYLFHRMAIAVVDRVISQPLVNDLCALVLTLAVAALVHKWVERPCATLRKRLEVRVPVTQSATRSA